MNWTVRDLMVKVIELADAKPDHVYEPPAGRSRCQYVHRDINGTHIPDQGCILGQALVALGVKADLIPERVSILDVLSGLGPRTGDDPWYYLQTVQRSQDNGAPWGEAVEPLRRYLASLS